MKNLSPRDCFFRKKFSNHTLRPDHSTKWGAEEVPSLSVSPRSGPYQLEGLRIGSNTTDCGHRSGGITVKLGKSREKGSFPDTFRSGGGTWLGLSTYPRPPNRVPKGRPVCSRRRTPTGLSPTLIFGIARLCPLAPITSIWDGRSDAPPSGRSPAG
jgi:hypothetical protein